jgi:hypothetical protein
MARRVSELHDTGAGICSLAILFLPQFRLRMAGRILNKDELVSFVGASPDLPAISFLLPLSMEHRMLLPEKGSRATLLF